MPEGFLIRTGQSWSSTQACLMPVPITHRLITTGKRLDCVSAPKDFAFISGLMKWRGAWHWRHWYSGNVTTGHQKQLKSWRSSQASAWAVGCWAVDQWLLSSRPIFSILKGSNITLTVAKVITARNHWYYSHITNPEESEWWCFDLSPRYCPFNSSSSISQNLSHSSSHQKLYMELLLWTRHYANCKVYKDE